MRKKVGILGSGIVGQTLADGFLKHGYEVMVGTRDRTKLAEWLKRSKNKGKVGSFSETARFADIAVLACKGSAAVEVLEQAGADNFKDKTVLDATNPITDAPPQKSVLKFFTSLEDSLMERLQKQVPEARFVKAFNSVGSGLMVNPDFGRIKPTMFICGNNAEAKKEATEILEKFGWESEDMGSVEAARAIEPLCILWCIPGFLRNQWSHAFKLLKQSKLIKSGGRFG